MRRFLAYSQANAREHGITPQQHQALLSIRGGFPDRDLVTITELADHLCVKHQSAVELVDRLVALELVYRQPSTEDRRTVFVGLTATAEAMLSSLSAGNLGELGRLKPLFAALMESLADADET
jgi:DNA-binding MarR family transcriptional regulator